ncbi:toll/interleukin-1 receptor domain-containing protein [Priestia aryabhattai]|uniref:toll/interleukin-1 receptor domain-containing protein n=1 Tax=Priestia aryabhattai TaxID=412384 RepID=UPI0030C9B4A5
MRYFVIGSIVNNNLKTEKEKERFHDACIVIGQTLCKLGHSLVVCSPFKDSADYWVIEGFKQGNPQRNQVIEFHFIDQKQVCDEIEKLEESSKHLRVIKIPYSPPKTHSSKSNSYAWLLCQLQALESCQIIIAVGGKLDGSANMLLLLAESKRKKILPLSFLGGAAEQSFYRKRYELQDIFGDKSLLLQDEKNIISAVELSHFQKSTDSMKKKNVSPTNFFISYPRARPAEADHIEALLRRRNLQVFRDESKFGAGHAIPTLIEEAIYGANIFIAVWCTEYACSPWCFDEFELALDRADAEEIELWIICVDSTRIVPKRARNLHYYSVTSREEIEGCISKLLENEIR